MKTLICFITWIFALVINLNAQSGYDEFKKEQKRIKDSTEAAENKIAYQKRKSKLTEKYGSVNAGRILKQEIWIGMTLEQAIESLGDPKKINETVTSKGTEYQLVYSDRYLYFEKGVLKSYQRSY